MAGRFVGCHPLAGTEATGPAAADAALYRGKPCFVCPGPKADAGAIEAARQLWQGIGASVIHLDPAAHDEFMAAASHLPHVAAFSLALGLEDEAEMLIERIPPTYPPTSLRDCTRVAASNPAVWRDILLENRAHLLPKVARFEAALAELRGALERQDADGVAGLAGAWTEEPAPDRAMMPAASDRHRGRAWPCSRSGACAEYRRRRRRGCSRRRRRWPSTSAIRSRCCPTRSIPS